MALVIIIGIAIALFVLAFVTKRRFGVLGLGLSAGVVLAQLWAVTLSAILQSQNIPVEPLSYSTVGQVAITLIPPLLLMIAGPKYHDTKGALVGSLLFAVFAVLLVIAPITRDFAVAGDTSPLFDFIAVWENALVAGCLVLAVIDTLFSHKHTPARRSKDKH